MSSSQELQEIQRAINQSFAVVGLLYMYLARPVFDQFGMKGEIAVREALRHYGRFRGERMRDWHIQEGLPINMETFQRFWDNGFAYLSMDGESTERHFKPYEERHIETSCPAFDYWREQGWQHFGYIYCDEVHQEITRAYKPEAIVEIHENLNKGDSFCSFVYMMPPEGNVPSSVYDQIYQKLQKDPNLFYKGVLKRTVRMVGSLYYFLAKATDGISDAGEGILRESLRQFSRKTAQIMKNQVGANSTMTVDQVLHSFLLPYSVSWTCHTRNNSIVISNCPLAEVWKELGDRKYGPIYCQETYGPLFEAMRFRTDVKECIACGNEKCVINCARQNSS